MFPHVGLLSSFFKKINPNNINVHMRLMMKTNMNTIIKKENYKDLNVERC
jgi:aspartokinase